jgi:hypothetical protein
MTFHSLNLVSLQDHFSCHRASAATGACRVLAWLIARRLSSSRTSNRTLADTGGRGFFHVR